MRGCRAKNILPQFEFPLDLYISVICHCVDRGGYDTYTTDGMNGGMNDGTAAATAMREANTTFAFIVGI
jgi:hypothetical protein